MSSLILYLLESSAVLVILYSLYWLLLSKETFFSLNRFFLLAILAFSFLFPLLSFDLSPSSGSVIDKPIGELRDMRMSYYDAFEAWSYETVGNSLITESTDGHLAKEKVSTQPLLLTIALIIYGIGLAAVVFRLIWSYCWVQRLKNSSQKEVLHGLTVVKISHQIAPFSFLNSVFVHQDMVQSEDFDQILAHEKTHIRERHSLDLIFVQLSAAVLWFNPVVWQLVKSLKATHEYIADKKIIDQGYSLVKYQTLLLRQLISNNSYGLIHNFNLLFIKRRITMMNIEKSGWTGKAKVALVLSAVVVFSLVIMQCNSRTDEQVLLESQASSSIEVSNGIDLPVLPESGYKFNLDPSNSLNLTIAGNKITINGEVVEVDQIVSVLENTSDEQDIIITRIDRAQPMALVREVQWEFRKADRLKFLYVGQTPTGKEQVEVPLLLPPVPGNNLPAIDEKYATENNIGLLKIQMDDHTGSAIQQKVYDFVKGQLAEQKSNYVVSARFSDDDIYNDYLVNLYYIKEGFHQIYDERAQEMYGKSFSEISENRSINEEYGEMYNALRQGIPMALSIAED